MLYHLADETGAKSSPEIQAVIPARKSGPAPVGGVRFAPLSEMLDVADAVGPDGTDTGAARRGRRRCVQCTARICISHLRSKPRNVLLRRRRGSKLMGHLSQVEHDLS